MWNAKVKTNKQNITKNEMNTRIEQTSFLYYM